MLFQLYSWGEGACLGCGSPEAVSFKPRLVEDLQSTHVVDISYIYVLFQLYSWSGGACLGCGSPEAVSFKPRLVEDLQSTHIVDIFTCYFVFSCIHGVEELV